MKKDCLILIDFDHTVFNTTCLVDYLKKIFNDNFGIDENLFIQHRNSIKECCQVIDMDRFVNSFADFDSKNLHTAVHDVIKQYAQECIFSDVLPFFEKMQNKCDIMITTHGDEELQTEKIQHSGLPDYVDYVISLESKDVVVAKYIDKYNDIYFIDDKSGNIDVVKTSFPQIKTYHIRRPEDMPYGKTKSTCNCADNEIESLDSVVF